MMLATSFRRLLRPRLPDFGAMTTTTRSYCPNRPSSSSSPTEQNNAAKSSDDGNNALQEDLSNLRTSSAISDVRDSRMEMKPFVKELFVGEFDTRLLSYPDVLENDRYYALEVRCKKIRAHLQSKHDLLSRVDTERHISHDVLLPLKALGVYGMRADQQAGGQGLCATETLKVLEEFGAPLSLGQSILSSNTQGYRPLETSGSEQQKAKYLPRLLSGEWVGAFCVADEGAGTDIDGAKVIAEYDVEEKIYYLSGTKRWVTHGQSANLFTVLANVSLRYPDRPNVEQGLTAFLVERDSPGVTIGAREAQAGLKGLETCRVTFDRTPVPLDNVLGKPGMANDVYISTVLPDRYFLSAAAIASLRHLLNLTVRHVLRRKAFGQPLAEFELVQHKLANMSARLYALESTAYMTAGLQDIQATDNTVVESSLTKLLTFDTARYVVDTCLSLFGSQSYLEDKPLHRIAQDLKGLEYWESTGDLVNLYVALECIMHKSQHEVERIRKLRNPMKFPFEYFKLMVRQWRNERNQPKMYLKLFEHVHPSLEQNANMLEYCVHRLVFATESCLLSHGQNVQLRSADLTHISESAMLIYAMTSAIGRANRSYCQGHPHSAHEVDLAKAFTVMANVRLKELERELLDAFETDNDAHFLQIGKYSLKNGGYCPTHPMTRNIF